MKLLIWGTGSLAANFMRFGYFESDTIVGFIDTYKKSELFLDCSVYSPKEVKALDYDRLIVCVLRHNKEILNTCLAEGIDTDRLFFIHNETIYDGVTERVFADKVKLIEKDYPLIAKRIEAKKEQFNYMNNKQALKPDMEDFSEIKTIDKNHIVAWIPIELLFSEKRNDVPFVESCTEEWERQNKEYQDLPIISFEPYRNLFNFFQYGKNFPWTYCKWFQNLYRTRGLKSEYTDEMIIEKRYREYQLMRTELQTGRLDFFIENPAIAVWNTKGYFNLMDGHHRTMFLYSAGYSKIPVQITRKDYEIWSNPKQAKIVKNIIIDENRMDFYQPILNPYFMNIRSQRDMTVKNRLQLLLEYFNNKRFNGIKVIDIGGNLGYFGQQFARLGADVTLIEPDPYHYRLAQEVNKLLYINMDMITNTFEEYSSDSVFDVAIMLTVFCWCMENESVCKKFLNNLNKNILQMIFWESGREIEKEKKCIIENTKFKNYVHLGYTYGTGKFRELGLFIADGSEYLNEEK